MKLVTNAWLALLPRPAAICRSPLAVTTSSSPTSFTPSPTSSIANLSSLCADALVVGHEEPALQGVAADVARLGPIHVADQLHRRPFQPDADQLHAVVGLDHDLGEIASSAKRR